MTFSFPDPGICDEKNKRQIRHGDLVFSYNAQNNFARCGAECDLIPNCFHMSIQQDAICRLYSRIMEYRTSDSVVDMAISFNCSAGMYCDAKGRRGLPRCSHYHRG